jgi:hypothetical protein
MRRIEMTTVATASRGAVLAALLSMALLVSFLVVRAAYGSSNAAVRVVQFYLDRKRGDAKGEGFKDVGTWHAASPSTKTATSMPPTNPYGGGYR